MALAESGRQSGHLWQHPSQHQRNGSFLLVIVWIDDIAIAYANNDESFFDEFATAYGKRFKSKVTARVDKFITLKTTRNRNARALMLSQELLFIEKMADRFLPNKRLRKLTTTPAWFTEKAQRVRTLSKLGIAATESDSDEARQALPRARR
eukprot:6211789-Pleurochrysis_carterae.AAC.2